MVDTPRVSHAMSEQQPNPEPNDGDADMSPRTGRRLILTEAIITAFANNIAMGLTWDEACSMIPIHRDTAFDWRARGDKIIDRLAGRSPDGLSEKQRLLHDFALAVRRAIPRRKRKLLNVIHNSTLTVWQSAAWLLERLHPDEFGQRARHEVTGQDGGPVTVAAVGIPKDVQDAIARVYTAVSPVVGETAAQQNNDDDGPPTFDPYAQRG